MTSAAKLKLLGLILLSLLVGCNPSAPAPGLPTGIPELKELKGEIFGSYYLIKYTGSLEASKFQGELDTFFQKFNSEFSTYQDNSTVSDFNRLRANQRLRVSPRFIEMLKFIDRLHKNTNGAFDPTLRPVIRLWGFAGSDKKTTPTAEEIRATMKLVGWKFIAFDEKRSEVWKTRDGVEIDTNAFAPGWASDLIGDMLKRHGINNFMVDISGEILALGEKRPGYVWVVGIEKPSQNIAQAVQMATHLKDAAIATSGDYRQYFDEKGKRRSHIIDPRTGYPVDNSVTSASVIANTAQEADTWSTAMMVLGEAGIAVAEKNGIKVFLLKATGPNKFSEVTGPSMKAFLDEYGL